MTHRLSMLLAFALAPHLVSAGESDEARYKSKAYEPRTALRDSAYRPSAYTPSATPRPIGKPVDESHSSGFWSFFKSDHAMAEQKQLHDRQLADAEVFRQQKNISVPTVKGDPRDVPEKKPFVEKGDKLDDASFKPDTTPRGKNPLLTPRQGIKAPE